ncbi:MAG: enoyl-CoA hydratase-related protein [Rubrivivax sp.]
MLLNQNWTAAEAAANGLVSRVVPDADLQAQAWALARQLAQGPTRAYGEIKNLLLSSFEQPIEAQLELEARAIARTVRSDDAWNAIQAVADKQRPTFTGR